MIGHEYLHYKIYILGRVQGVGFRYEARSVARFYSIKGIVKNLMDGRVYIEAEGTKDALDSFLTWCRKGPEYGFVESVIMETGETKGYSVFEIVL